MFQTVPLSIVRSFSLYTQQWLVYVLQLASRIRMKFCPIPSWSCLQAVIRPVWLIPLLCVQWKPADDGQRNCLKHVEFYSKKIRFGKLVHLVGFIVRIYHDARSPEHKILSLASWTGEFLWSPVKCIYPVITLIMLNVFLQLCCPDSLNIVVVI